MIVGVLVIGIAGSLVGLLPKTTSARASDSQIASSRNVSRISLPLFFEPNQGQTDSRVKFVAHGAGYGLFLTSDEAVLTLQRSTADTRLAAPSTGARQTGVIRMRLEGANRTAKISASDRLPGKSNYFIGNDPKKWRTGIPQFARVNYPSVYPGIDLTYYGNQRQLEYDFRVAPGADPNRIALSFAGASSRLEAGELVLATPQGEVRFHAPQIYQQIDNTRRTIAGSFRQLADNKIGFEIGRYDRTRELVIDPILNYATFLGGSGLESFTRIAVDSGLNMYVAAVTTSPTFQTSTLKGGSDILVAKINPAGTAFVYTTYLGGSGDEPVAAGIAVIAGQDGPDATVAGTTTSSDFPTTATNAFQTAATGVHGFLTKLDTTGALSSFAYSTYLAGNGTDSVTGLAVHLQHALVTGITTSNNSADGFPSTTTAFQVCAAEPGITCTPITNGPPQFFASQINTAGTGKGSMLYSTYVGGNNPGNATSLGGGITVDSSERMYFTGSTNMLGVVGANGEHPFPLVNAQQSCLDEAGLTSGCAQGQTAFDAILVKINPAISGSASLIYSTYLGGSADDLGNAVSVDSSGNAYVTGQTSSVPWNVSSSRNYGGGSSDAFVAKVTNPASGSTIFPLSFFQYLGGSGADAGQDIAVDTVQGAHITGWTDSPDFPVSLQNNLQPFGGARDAFIALISSTGAAGSYSGFLGGSGLDQGTSIALDPNLDSSPVYVGGFTQSGNFITHTQPLQAGLQTTLAGSQDSFVAIVGSRSDFTFDTTNSSVNPTPATVGNQVTFKFVFDNTGPDPASNVVFSGTLPPSGFTFSSANSSPGTTCPNPVGSKLTCPVGIVASGSSATITVVLVPTSGTTSLTVTPSISSNGGAFVTPDGSVETVTVSDFGISVDPKSATITAGQSTSFVITLKPSPDGSTYKNSISVSHSSLPTGATGTFTSSSVTITGTSPVTTTLSIATTARPATNAALWHSRDALYATWLLPVGGLSLLGFGVGWKRRRWLAGSLLGLMAALVLLQLACGNSSSSTPPNSGTPAGTYSIILTGASGSASHNVPVTLTVN